MRSCDVHHLQFESKFVDELRQYVAIPGSERLVCPICGYEHTEEDKPFITENGDYIHKLPELIETSPSFQCGVLASQLKSLNWTWIANEQLQSGKSADLASMKTFDNSVRRIALSPTQSFKRRC